MYLKKSLLFFKCLDSKHIHPDFEKCMPLSLNGGCPMETTHQKIGMKQNVTF